MGRGAAKSRLSMASTEQLITFLLATAVFAYMPGPALLYTAAQTIARGRKAGWMTALGLHIGGYTHVVAAALGLSVLFASVPILFTMIKLAGAAYLIWLGIQLFIANEDFSSSESIVDESQSTEPALWQSMTVEILNPKTAVFYIAFLPQFTDPASALPLWGQLVILGTFVNIAFSSADILCVLLSSYVVKYFRKSPSGARVAQRVGGTVLVGLGVNLAVSRL